MKAILARYDAQPNCIFGMLSIGNDFLCHTIELPWRNNSKNNSCIPPGAYVAEMTESPKFGLVYKLRNVPERSHILIHAGNYPDETNGCILVGVARNGNNSIRGSRAALNALHAYTAGEVLQIDIEERYESLDSKPV